MAKRFFHDELSRFRSDLVLMGRMAVESFRDALHALEVHDLDLAADVRKRDDDIDDLEVRVDAEAIRYLSLRAPVATDLRLIIVGTKAGHDLERVADEATNIAKRLARLNPKHPFTEEAAQIQKMGAIATSMLEQSFNSFLEGDETEAVAICRRDSEVDTINRDVFSAISRKLAEHPEFVADGVELMFMAKAIERVGDHATNLAEEVIFLTSAADVRHDRTLKGK